MREALFTYFPAIATAFLTAFALVVWFVPKVRDFAIKINAVQHGGGRRIHQGSIPNIGGIAIFLGFLVALLLTSTFYPKMLDAYRVELLAITVGAALMTLVGFIDDLWEVPPAMRLASQFLAAGILVVNGVKVDFITNYFATGDYVYFGQTAAVLITMLWIVGFTNAFNFIDGLDGLSSGVAAISSFSLLAVAVQFPDRGAAILLLTALAGASLGFLRHNFSPAKIIMGDSGAYLLGYVLAAVSVLGALKVSAAVTIAAPILILALPVVNITQVTVRRLSKGVSPAEASNDHLHDLIRIKSGSKQFTVISLWLVALALGILGMFLSNTPTVLLNITVVTTVLSITMVCVLRLVELRRERINSLGG